MNNDDDTDYFGFKFEREGDTGTIKGQIGFGCCGIVVAFFLGGLLLTILIVADYTGVI